MDVCADVLLSESIWNLRLLDHLVKRADIVAPYLRDDKLTGIQIGAGQILARLDRKSVV